jgi:hypothetical protein
MSRSLEQRYLEFRARSDAVFARYPQMEPLRSFVFRDLLVRRCAGGWKDQVKHRLRPFLKRARTRLPDRHADVLMWLESRRTEAIETLMPVYRELVARGLGVELVSFDGPANLPVPSRVFEFRTRPGVPRWARGAWEGLAECEHALRGRALERSFYHACAMLQGLLDEVRVVLEASAPKAVLCASTQVIGGAALMLAARLQGITSLVLQHGMLGWNYMPIPADLTLIWGPSSEEVMALFGVPRARLITVGSPRHDLMRPSGNGHARATLLRALGLSERPTFVFFSQGSGPGSAAVESARWLEESAARYSKALNVVVRLHPNEDGALYQGRPHLTVMSQAVELSVALDGCDWIGSISSTALYDGLLYGKQPWQFWADHWPVEAHNWTQGLARRVSSGDHLNAMMRERLSQGGRDGVDEVPVERVFANHGRATQAVADVVASCLRPSAGNPRAATVEQVAGGRT